MATFNKPIATNQGIALLKAEVAGTDSITFTKTVFSSDDYSQTADSDIANLTAIQSMDLTTNAQTFQDVNGNTKVRAIGYNNSVNQAFYIKTYALYAKNKAGNEILFAVASSQTADFVPAFNNAQLTQISYTFTFAIDQTSNITLSDQHEITVTQADIASINSAVNSNASSLSSSMSSISNSLSSSITNNSSAINSLVNSASSAIASNAQSIQDNGTAITTISNIANQAQATAYQGLRFMGVVPGNFLYLVKTPGIYDLAGKNYTDWGRQVWGQYVVIDAGGGVTTQIVYNNTSNCWVQTCNNWGNSGFKAVY